MVFFAITNSIISSKRRSSSISPLKTTCSATLLQRQMLMMLKTTKRHVVTCLIENCLRNWVRKGVSIDIGRQDMNPRPLVPLVRTAAVIFGGVVTLNLTSTVTIKLLRFASEKKREKAALPCRACRGKGFYICKLCNGNATIAWSPMFDPIAINPCVCPTCEGNRVQRCLNCLGKGYD